MDLLERASLLEELHGVLAATAVGGRVALLADEAGIGPARTGACSTLAQTEPRPAAPAPPSDI